MVAAFDQDRADEIVRRIGVSVLDSDMSDKPWQSAVMVANLDGRKAMFGYCFWGDGEWEAATPKGFATLLLFVDLHKATFVDGQPSWKKAKLQVVRESREISLEFNASGTKWMPDHSDPGAFAQRLRSGME